MKKIILFGSGRNGRLALKHVGIDKVAFFCDNNKKKIGTFVGNKEVISFDKMLDIYNTNDYCIMITPGDRSVIRAELELSGIEDYIEFDDQYEFHRNHRDDAYGEARNKYKTINDKVDEFVARSRKMDLLQDTMKFATLVEEIMTYWRENNWNGGGIAYFGRRGESDEYGNMSALLDYAGITDQEAADFPKVSHHIWPVSGLMGTYEYRTAVIFAGMHYKKCINERFGWLPVFSVGPYVHYAKSFYTEDEIKAVKEKYGRIITAFLPHSIEYVERDYDAEKFIDDVIEKYGSQADSLWLCVYWTDINKPVIQYARDKGMHIVSAGIRPDTCFIRRLKSIMEVSYATVVSEYGTNVTYSIYLGKPVGLLKSNVSIKNDSLKYQKLTPLDLEIFYGSAYDKDIQQFKNLVNEKLVITPEQIAYFDEMAGFSQVKTPAEIRQIYEISRDLWQTAEYNVQKYPMAVYELYKNYYKQGEFEKMQILKGAIGNYII